MADKQIHYSSDEAASLQTGLEGWVDNDGRYWGVGENAEHMARWSGCTHMDCKTEDCPNHVKRNGYMYCDSCMHTRDLEKYADLKRGDWDGKTPLFSHAWGKYFFCSDEIQEEIDQHNEDNPDFPQTFNSLRFVICTAESLHEIDPCYWEDCMPEDSEDMSKEMDDAIEALNVVIRKQPPVSWRPGSIAVQETTTKEKCCKHCGEADVELIPADEPYNLKHWGCPNCDSTYVYEQYPISKE